tara:strand:+ start:402 stop:788 length:387 start_codon:yes stop_codon:yes gene_type:complete
MQGTYQPKKMLYFSDGSSGVDTTTEGLCVDASLLKSIEPISATVVNMYFDSLQSHVQTAADGTKNYDYVALTITSGKFKEVCKAITQAINCGPYSDGFIVICDKLNSLFVHSYITNCDIKYVDTDTAV